MTTATSSVEGSEHWRMKLKRDTLRAAAAARPVLVSAGPGTVSYACRRSAHLRMDGAVDIHDTLAPNNSIHFMKAAAHHPHPQPL